MPSAAKITVIGHMTEPKPLKHTPKGSAVYEFSVPVNNPKDDQDTAWYRVAVFGARAETLDRLSLSKGTLVCVTGKLTPRTWHKDGEARTSLDVAADDVLLLSKRDQQEQEVPF